MLSMDGRPGRCYGGFVKGLSARSRNALKNMAALMIGLALAFCLLEATLAWTLPAPLHYTYPQPLHLPDETLGWVMRPGQKSFTIDKPVTINSLGFRSPELQPGKPRATLRILCLGDSQTFGNGVSQDETYPARLEALLSERAHGLRVEVINAGVQGYDTEQEVRLLERFAPSLSPDIVLIGFYINDIGEVLRERKASMVEAKTGEFERGGIIKRFTPYRLIYLLKRSRDITLIDWRVRILLTGGRANSDNAVLLGSPPPQYERAWALIRQSLERARALAVSRGIRLIIFPVPFSQEFLGDYPREQYRSRLLNLARSLGVDHLDPTPVMKSADRGFERYFITWDGHISATAHAVIAELLADEIMPRASIPKVGGSARLPGASDGIP